MIDMVNAVELKVVSSAPASEDVEGCVTFAFASACMPAPARLSARMTAPESEMEYVAWSITSGQESRDVVRTDPHYFRMCLARVAVQLLGGQLYGGYGRRRLRIHQKGDYPCAIYMSNEGLSGFWLEAYVGGPSEPPNITRRLT